MILKVQFRGEPDRHQAIAALAHQVCNRFSPHRHLEIRPAEWNLDHQGFEPGLTCIKISPLEIDPARRVLGVLHTIEPISYTVGDREEYVVAVDVQ